MGKLNNRKLRWILRELSKEDGQSVHQIAKHHDITDRWVRNLRSKYKGIPIGDVQMLRRGRKPLPVFSREVIIVHKTKEKYGSGAVNIQKILASNGVKMAHNRIHKILVQGGLANREPKKSKQRKWVRWERRHSNSMWHTDFTEGDDGKQIILYEDDASRCIMGYGKFDNATTNNAILVFDDAVELWGVTPKELMTDHGSQFCEDENREYRFRNHIQSRGVKHVLARVKYPQTNGKQEKLGGTIKEIIRWKKCGLGEAVKFYNEVRPHMSLERNGRLRTPLTAYYEKMRPKQRQGIAYEKGLAYAKKEGSFSIPGLRLELEKDNLVAK